MSLPLSPGEWILDPVHSNVAFAVRHLAISTLRGRFGAVNATLTVGEDLAGSSLRAEVDLSSVDTGNPDRDGHLKSTDFFSVETKPKMTFESSTIDDLGDNRYRLTGALSLNGTSGTETLEARFFGVEKNPLDGSTRAGFEAVGRLDRTDYGLMWNVPMESGQVMVANDIDMTLNAQLVGPEA